MLHALLPVNALSLSNHFLGVFCVPFHPCSPQPFPPITFLATHFNSSYPLLPCLFLLGFHTIFGVFCYLLSFHDLDVSSFEIFSFWLFPCARFLGKQSRKPTSISSGYNTLLLLLALTASYCNSLVMDTSKPSSFLVWLDDTHLHSTYNTAAALSSPTNST
jgi:hypothetical protein